MPAYGSDTLDDVARLETTAARLVVVSNRLPFVLSRKPSGEWKVRPGSGGLVNALLPVLRNRGGLWVGWTGAIDGSVKELEKALAGLTRDAGYRLQPIELTAEERDKFYYGFSNEVIWPLFHDLQTNCNFDPELPFSTAPSRVILSGCMTIT
jgi:trehalose-6-phosphate synthase